MQRSVNNYSNSIAAVISGSLKDLQIHLDRRKFSHARDRKTDVNLLQKSVLLGHHAVSRYLMNNFPDLVNMADSRGRTALHYAAALRDNSFIYRALINHGADTSVRDGAGRTPGYYAKNKKELNKDVLTNFMQSDPSENIQPKKRKNQIKTKSKAPAVIESLVRTDSLFTTDVPDETLSRLEKVFDNFQSIRQEQSKKENLSSALMDPQLLDENKLRVCRMSGGSLLDVLQLCTDNELDLTALPALPLLAPDPTAYDVFSSLFNPWIEKYHGYKITQK